MVAGKLNLLIEQGSDFSKPLVFKQRTGNTETPIDLTGWTFTAQIRRKHQAAEVLGELQIVVLSAIAGTVELRLPHNITSGIKANVTRDELPDNIQNSALFGSGVFEKGYVWDLEELPPNGPRVRRLEGRIFVTPEVTRG
jgi:hypothetical protein